MSGACHRVAVCMIHVVAGMGHSGPTVFMVTLQPWCGGGRGGERVLNSAIIGGGILLHNNVDKNGLLQERSEVLDMTSNQPGVKGQSTRD